MNNAEEISHSNGIEPLNVFLDTNAFHKAHYSYDSGLVENLREQCRAGRAKIYANDIVKREVMSHISNEIDEHARRAKNKLKDDCLAFKAMPIHERKALVEALLDIPKNARSYYEVFFSEAEMLPYDDLPVRRLFDAYFEEKPPFEDRKEKKNEFPDAAIAYSVVKWMDRNPKKMLHVVTEDEGLRSAIGDSENVVFHSSIGEVLDCISKGNKLYESVVAYVREGVDDFKDSVKEWLEDRDWDFVADLVSDMIEFDCIDYVEVEQLKVDRLLVEHIDEESRKVNARLFGSSQVELSFFYIDHEREWYDREDREYYGTENGEGRCSMAVPFAANIEIDISSESVDEWLFEVVDVSSHREDTEIISSELNLYCDGLDEPPMNTCPDCGEAIGFENDGGNGYCSVCARNH